MARNNMFVCVCFYLFCDQPAATIRRRFCATENFCRQPQGVFVFLRAGIVPDLSAAASSKQSSGAFHPVVADHPTTFV
jgi:hypothetical protein